MKTLKLPRLPRKDNSAYTTGDAQEWTYGFTWEDLDACNDMIECPSEPLPTRQDVYRLAMLEYFYDHPEALHGGPIFAGMTTEKIRTMVEDSLQNVKDRIGEYATKEAAVRWGRILANINQSKN